MVLDEGPQVQENWLTLKMKAIQSFEMLGTAHTVTQLHIPEHLNLLSKFLFCA